MKEFEDNQELAENYEYLKKYLQEHPDNQMAWYLLGRKYSVKGETKKAEYCFRKAGDVYKVFEQMPDIHQLQGSPSLSSPQFPYMFSRIIFIVKRGLFIAGIMLLLLYTNVLSPHPDSNHSDQNGLQEQPLQILYTSQTISAQDWDRVISELVMPRHHRFQYSIVAEPSYTTDGQWMNWHAASKLILSAERFTDEGRLQVQYYDEESCICLPSNATVSAQLYDKWKDEEEQTIVTVSAIQAYQVMNQAWPQHIDDLTQDYPRNILPGYSEYMQEHFDEIVVQTMGSEADANQDAGSPNRASPTGQDSIDPPTLQSAQLQEPLEIIVDTANYRLALVSGNKVLRNYPVGLGGEETPEGEFIISEKVRDPLGVVDGVFGTRGMTLSDTLYAIHGTNEPETIETDFSLGCVRMLDEDIEELFDMIPLHTKVTITSNTLPDEIIRSETPRSVPANSDETNSTKIYEWL